VTLTPLTRANPAAVASSLEQLGWNSVEADAASTGLKPVGCVLRGLTEDEIHTTLLQARKSNVEALSGDGWIVLASSNARMGGMVMQGRSVLSPDVFLELAGFLRSSFEPSRELVTGRGVISLDEPLIVGILNLTPDSFSDGGAIDGLDAAIARVDEMRNNGAGMIDVGGESTRPGVEAGLPEEEEWDRIRPVLERLVGDFPELPISVDTVNLSTARRSLDSGAWVINDVSGLRLNPGIAGACAEHQAGLIVMHSRGQLTDMATYQNADYSDVVSDVSVELGKSVAAARAAGVADESLVIDPGLGFSKRPEHNFEILRELEAFQSFGLPVMIGPSRKRFLGQATGNDMLDRDGDTATACALAHTRGARLFRVHSVKETADALLLTHAIDS
jgi:dihydropteroate synthase